MWPNVQLAMSWKDQMRGPHSTPARDPEVLYEYRFNQETRTKVTGGCQAGRRVPDLAS
jgi:hypothetical protein